MTTDPQMSDPFGDFENPVENYFAALDRLNFTFKRAETDVPSDFTGQPTILLDDTVDEAFNGDFQNANRFFYSLFQTMIPKSGPPTVASLGAKESWESFIEAMSAGIVGSSQGSDPFSGPVYDVFMNHFKIQHGIPFDVTNDLGDFEVLYQALGEQGSREDFLNQLFRDAMTLFLTRFNFVVPEDAQLPGGGPDPDFNWIEEFTTNLSRFLTIRAGVDTEPFPLSSAVNLSMYERIFNQFVPQPPDKSFQEVLAEFHSDIIKKERFFLPSHHLKDWMEKVQQRRAVETNTDLSIAGTNSAKTIIIMQLLALLVEVIDVLQNVAAAQGARLQFYAEMQRAYTDLIAQVPIINSDDTEWLNKRDKESRVERMQGFGAGQIQAVTEQLRARRTVLGDEANQHQTTVNQSNEIVTQQTNLGTSLLQQLSTILTTMFK